MIRRRKSGKYRNIGLLILRMGLGVILVLYGAPKLFGGPESWTSIGEATQHLGINAAPMFFGFIMGVAEFFGGLFLIFGLFFKPSLGLLIIVMGVTATQQIAMGNGFSSALHHIDLIIIFISLLLIGPGKYSFDYRLNSEYRRY